MNANGAPPVIKLKDLTKIFATDEVETHALSKVSMEIARGEYVSIGGPSGCGKSTRQARCRSSLPSRGRFSGA